MPLMLSNADEAADSPPELPSSIQDSAKKHLFGVDDFKEINSFYKDLYAFEKAKNKPLNPEKRQKRTLVANADTAAEIPKIYVFQGHNTTFTIVDNLGNPWPILYATTGNKSAYSITKLDGVDHILNMSAGDRFIPSNLTLILKGKNEPIILTLHSDAKTVDYSIKLMVPGISPAAQKDILPLNLPNIPLLNNPIVGKFLDDAPPREARIIPMTGNFSTQAWKWKSFVVIRTMEQVIDSNASVAHTAKTPDKTWSVFFLKSPPPVLQMLTKEGKVDYITLLYGEENYADGIDNQNIGESFYDSVELSKGT